MTKFCNECNKPISEEVYQYSRKHFSRSLCREHQRISKKPEPTPPALKLGNLLKSMGHKIEFEKYDGYKHIDIAIVKSKVNIEVDGSQHQGKEQALRDLKRTFYSWNKEYVTLRIPNSLTQDNIIEETAKYIDKFLKANRNQLEKEIREEYVEEGNPFWNDVTNFLNSASKLVNNVSTTFNKISNSFNGN